MLKLKRFSEGVWFDFPRGGRFKIRPLCPKDYLDLREQSKTGKISVVKPDGSWEIVDNYDEARFFWKIFTHQLEDWADIIVDGASTPDEIKETIFNEREIRDWITEKSSEIYVKEQGKLEDELKNSESSQSG